ncbi:RNA-binding protein 28-like [Watersipora subatra]|uniref:RNA-binding protein 28-like n=1 Tax=Watersipora subatra TaxID=2589382 RepID=UPI00355AD473
MGKRRETKESNKQSEPAAAGKTLFVQNIPFSATNEILLDVFKNHGPINSCFVVNDPISKKSRGIGYVKFVDSEDAAKAKKAIASIEGRKVTISYADSKKRTTEGKTTPQPSKTPVPTHRLIIRNLPFTTSESQLKEMFSGCKDVCSVEVPRGPDDKCKGFGFVSFSQKDSGDDAISVLNNKELNGRKLSIDWFLKTSDFKKNVSQRKKTDSKDSAKKGSGALPGNRIIIRNLPFKMSDEELKKLMSKYGEVDKVDTPSSSGKKRGFSFVTFQSGGSAEKAISELKEVKERPVAVDWAVDKATYLSNLSKDSSLQVSPSKGGKSPKSIKNATSSQKDMERMSSPDDKLGAVSEPDAEIVDESESNSEQEDESGSEDELEHESGSNDDIEDDSAIEVNEDYSSSDDSSLDASDDEMEKGGKNLGTKAKKIGGKSKKAHSTSSADVAQDRTIFLRNVGYETTEDQLAEVFNHFGDVSYTKLLVDPMTERSRGVAFVQYKKKAHAEKCLEAAQDDQQKSLFVVDGRDLNVTLAISREKIKELVKAKEKQPKDKRNLFLAREGLIRQGTQAAHGISKNDMNKRTKLESMMRAKLKSPFIFISPTRLCIHNLPVKLNDKQLKSICLKSVQEKTAKISECRIIRDLTNVNADGIGKSRGYAFVEFGDHKHAIAALRHLNNNPEIFTNEKRPIVEFSLENTKALQAKERRLQTERSSSSGNAKTSSKAVKTKLNTRGSDAQVERPKGVKPGLPSHHGPKVRHKPRPSSLVDPKKEAQRLKKRKEQEINRRVREDNQQPKPKKMKYDAPDSFDKLVSSYRNKISARSQAKAKWFE